MIEFITFIFQSVQRFINLSLNNDIGRMFLALIFLGGGIAVAKAIKNLFFSTSSGN